MREKLIQGEIIELLRRALDDYCGARACFLWGCIPSAYVLSAQSIEKLLKSLILSLKPNYGLRNIRKLSHSLDQIISECQELLSANVGNDIGIYWRPWVKTWLARKYRLNEGALTYAVTSADLETIDRTVFAPHADFLKKLDDSYDYFRYTESYPHPHGSWGASELHILDLVWVESTELFPLPILVKPELPLVSRCTREPECYRRVLLAENRILPERSGDWEGFHRAREDYRRER